MASSKLMASSTSRNSDLRRKSSTSSSTIFDFGSNSHLPNDAGSTNLDATDLSVSGILRNVYADGRQENTLLNAEITLLDAAGAIAPIGDGGVGVVETATVRKKTVDEVWREIVEGKREESQRRRRKVECKEESMDQMMTLEDFLVKAGAVDESEVAAASDMREVKVEAPTERLSGGIFAFDSPVVVSPLHSGGSSGTYMRSLSQSVDGMVGYGNGMELMGGGGLGRGKRRASLMDPLDKATQQRQKRMIKNRESAARSRERKQAYQVELEAMAVRLEEENERLLKEKAEWAKERFKQLMENVIPVAEKPRPTRVLRRIRSAEW